MQTFIKAERLSSKVAIDQLFETGKSFHSKPFKIVWLKVSEGVTPVQIVISVPKRLFKRAVDRNKLKRLIKEAYRKNKNNFYQKLEGQKFHLMFIYTSKIMEDHAEIERKVILSLERLMENINTHSIV